MLPREDLVEIGRLRVHSSDPPGGHAGGIGVALGSLDLRPPGFRGSEVLVIRALADPAPGSITTARGASVPAAWELATREQIAALYRSAARPGSGHVMPDARAVLFADIAELLAALALDWLTGRTHERWWWTTYVRRHVIDAVSIAGLMTTHAAAVPPMIRTIAARGSAEALVARLGATASVGVSAAVCRAYGLEDLASELDEQPAGDAADEQPPMGTSVTVDRGGRGGSTSVSSSFGVRGMGLPWHEHVLLSIALTLAESPGAARSPAFPREVRRAWRSPLGGPVVRSWDPTPAREVGSRTLERRPAASRPLASEATTAQGSPANARTTPHRRSASVSDRATSSMVTEPGRAGVPPSPPHRTRSRPSPTAVAGRPEPPPLAIRTHAAAAREPGSFGVQDRAETGTIGPAHATRGATTQPDGATFETDLGGVFFLINVMAHLGLPDAFEPGWRLASGAGAWEVLELLGRALVDGRARRPADDAIWDALRYLDGRPPGTRAGAGLTRPTTYRIPRAWLDQDRSTRSEVRWALSGGQLVVWSTLGYVLMRTTAADPSMRVDRELSRLGLGDRRVDGSSAAVGSYPGLSLARLEPYATQAALDWAVLAAPFVRRRILRALGPGAGRRDVAAMLRRRASVHVSATHVDVGMSLADISVPVRRAGLDRDPGWQPAFGRVIRFQFA